MNIHLFDRYWYMYIFAKPDSPGWAFNSKWHDALNRYCCRIKGHPNGPVFYNSNGLEPDDRCKDCGDYI